MRFNEARENLKRAFIKDHRELCYARTKIGLLLAVGLVPFFSGLDYFSYPAHFKSFLLLRLISLLQASVFFLSLHFLKKYTLKYASAMLAIYAITLGALMSGMCYQLGGYESTYYAGLNLLILSTNVIMPWHPVYQVATNMMIYSSYLLQGFLSLANYDFGIWLNNNYFIFSTVLVTSISSVLQYRMHFLLKQKDEYKNQFFANVSHELKTPMTLVVTPLDNVLQKMPKTAGEVILSRATFESVRHNAYRLSGLISDILDLTKSEIGKARIAPVQIPNTREYFERIFQSVTPLMEEKGLKFEFVVGPPPVEEAKKV